MHPKVACRDIHTRIICIFRLFWRLFMQTGSSWVGWCYWSGVIYQAKFIPTSHYETLNLGKLLHILQKRLGIKRRRGGASHARIIHQRVKNMANYLCVVMWFFRNIISDFAVRSFGGIDLQYAIYILNCKINGTVHIFLLKKSYLSPETNPFFSSGVYP